MAEPPPLDVQFRTLIGPVKAAVYRGAFVGLKQVAENIVIGSTANLKTNKSDDTGFLRNSIHDAPGRTAGAIERRVAVGAFYGVVIEKGRKPAGIPARVVFDLVTGIAGWVKRHASYFKRTPKKAGGKYARKDDKFFRAVAAGIAKKKAEEFTPAKPFFEPAVQKFASPTGFRKSVEDAVAVALRAIGA